MEHRPVMHCPRCGGSKDKRNTTPSQKEHFFFTLKAWFKWWGFCLHLTYKKHTCCPQLRTCWVKQASEPPSILREPPTCRESRSHFTNEVQRTWVNGHAQPRRWRTLLNKASTTEHEGPTSIFSLARPVNSSKSSLKIKISPHYYRLHIEPRVQQ